MIIAFIGFALDPWRQPGKILHSGIQFLTFVGPLHWRRSDLPTKRRQLTHEDARLVLLLKNLPQPLFRHDPTAFETQTSTTDERTVDTRAPLSSL